MTIYIFNWLYLVIIIGLFAVTFSLVVFTKNRSPKFNYWFIFSLLLLNFILHFLKIFLPFDRYYLDLPYSFARISLENICAVSVVLFPFFYLFGNKYFKDVMVILGVISALAVYFYPSDAIGVKLDNSEACVEIFRFYFCHAPLFICPVLMLTNGFHTFSYKRVPLIPVVFYGYLFVIFINKLCLWSCGIIQCDAATFFSRDFANPSFVFGVSSSFDSMLWWVDYVVPPFLRYVTDTGVKYYFPVLWIIPISYPLFLLFLYSFMYVVGDRLHTKAAFEGFKQKIRLKRAK